MNVVALFLKAPVLGTVKTRLAKSLGDEGALMAYVELVEFLLKRIEETRIHVHYTFEDARLMSNWLGDSFTYTPQVGSGLGERLIHAMELEFAAGADRLIFIGGDCPYIDQSRLDDAFAALNDYDVVIGPAKDGGYYLIGIKEFRPELFTDVAWGTEAVLPRSLEICDKMGLSYFLLPEESDVDDYEGWEKAKAYMSI